MCIFLIKNNESFIIEYICKSALKKKGAGMIPIGNLFVSKIMLQTLILSLVRAKIL